MLDIRDLQGFKKNKEAMAELVFDYDLKDTPSVMSIKEKYLQDTLYTMRFLSISLEMNEPILFANYMKWFGKLAYYLKFDLDSMNRHFDVCKTIFNQQLEATFYQKVYSIFDFGITEFNTSYTNPKHRNPLISLFLQYLIEMDIDQAYDIIRDKMASGMTLQQIYLEILQPTLYEVGELWQQRIITVAKEHYITAAIQNIIGKLYPYVFREHNQKTYSMTGVCAGNEMHEIGMRMTTDFFELSGWDTTFLGSNLPIDLIVEHLIEYPTDLLAISATTLNHLVDLKELIHTVKQNEKLNHIKIIVGGKVFNDTPHLWKNIGADGFAEDAEQAILIANLIVGETHDKTSK